MDSVSKNAECTYFRVVLLWIFNYDFLFAISIEKLYILPLVIFSLYLMLFLPLKQALELEEDGVLCGSFGPEEQIIWTSTDVPYVVSYHNGMLDIQ
jgi:hypothetical protein